MSAFQNLDLEDFVQLAALSQPNSAESDHYAEDAVFADYDDDDDDDDDEIFSEFDDDDDDDENFSEFDDDDDDDEFYGDAETIGDADLFRRRRHRMKTRRRKWKSRRTPKLQRVRGSKSTVLRSASGQKMRVRFGNNLAKASEVNALIKKTEAKFNAAQKIAKKNHDALASQIARNTKTLNSRVKSVNSRLKKLEISAQTSQLLSLMAGPPALKKIKIKGGSEQEIEDTTYKSSNNFLLPLLLSQSSGGDNSQLMVMAMMMNKDDDE